MMGVYFDASLIVSLFVEDALTGRADAYIATHRPTPAISDLAAAEFASSVSRSVRMKSMTRVQGQAILMEFDAWRAREGTSCFVDTADVTTADVLLRQLDLPLRTPDALNIAIAERHGFELATFDEQMKVAARLVGLRLAPA